MSLLPRLNLGRSAARSFLPIAGTLVVFVLALSPPVLPVAGRALVQAAFSLVCHQLPERTLAAFGVPFAVCSRCLGIYAGLVLGTVLYHPSARLARLAEDQPGRMLLLALLVPGADWMAGVAGMWDSGHIGRILTGLMFGVIAGVFLARAARAFQRKRNHQSVVDAEPS